MGKQRFRAAPGSARTTRAFCPPATSRRATSSLSLALLLRPLQPGDTGAFSIAHYDTRVKLYVRVSHHC